MKRRTTLTLAATAGLFIALGAPLSASAHITIDPSSAEAGGFSLVTVKVPNESATATTNKVEVQLPTDTPFLYVSYVPVPGWSAQLTTTTLPKPVTVGENEITEAVTAVTWTAEPGSEIGDGQLQLFPLSVGPVPDTGSVILPATQTYTDGDVVQWNETTEGAENPAPVLYINDAPATDHHGGSHEAEDDSGTAVPVGNSTPAASGSSDDVLARVLGIAGLLVGAVGIVLAVTARRRSVQG